MSTGSEANRQHAPVAVVAFSVAMAVVAAALALLVHPVTTIGSRETIAWAVLLTVAFWLVELMPIHLEWAGQAYSLSLSELPLVLGLFFCPSLLLVVARALGGGVALATARRQRPHKLAFNIALQLLEATLAVVVFHLMPGHGVSAPMRAAPAVVTAIFASTFSGILAVTAVIRLSVGRRDLSVIRAFFRTGVIGVTVDVSTALVLTTALMHTAWVSLPMAVMLVALMGVYRAYASLRQRHQGLTTLFEFTNGLSQTTNTDDRIRDVLDRIRTMLRAERAGLLLVGSDPTEVSVLRWTQSDNVLHSRRYDETAADWPFAHVMRHEQVVVVPLATKAPEHQVFLDGNGFRDAVLAPLRLDDQVRGVLFVADREGDVATFTDDDGTLFGTVAAQVSSVLDNSRLLDRLTHDSLHDALTGLANRQLFQTRLQRATEMERPSVAVMLADLDRFKEINDTLGHHHGDLLIREIAARIAATAPAISTVARLGGDEFALLVPGQSVDEAAALAARIRDAISEPCVLDGVSVEVDASIGVAVAPRDGDDASVLLKRADMAMYAAKSAHTGVELYDSARDEYSPRRLALASRLRSGIQNGELRLHYQPQVDAETDSVVCAEALVRWRHPDYGVVPPVEFVPIAEQTGAIQQLTEWVLQTAVAQLAAWRRKGLDIGVAVNVSMRNLVDPAMVDDLLALLAKHDVPPPSLTLEITESHLMSDPSRTLPLLRRLADHGFRLSIDDFGTGYSSLSNLSQFPVHELKIDKSFLQGDPSESDHNRAIVRAIVSMSRHLGLETVAEGVEDEESRRLLTEIGCTRLQGFHYARPMPAEDLPRWIHARGLPVQRTYRPALRVVGAAPIELFPQPD